MKKTLVGLAWLVSATFFALPGAFSIELSGASATRPTTVASASWQAGTVVKIDAKSGELVLDGARRFAFSPGGGLIVHQPNGASGTLADVKAGASVRLSVVRGSVLVRELWIVR